MRMALILKLLREKDEKPVRAGKPAAGVYCPNPKCVCASEQELPPMEHAVSADEMRRCFYCDTLLLPVKA